MEAILIAIVIFEAGVVSSLIGYAFHCRSAMNVAQATVDRLREQNDEYREAEHDAKLAARVGIEVARNLGKLPPAGGSDQK